MKVIVLDRLLNIDHYGKLELHSAAFIAYYFIDGAAEFKVRLNCEKAIAVIYR
jgi:hypothetical protein